jgi:uncharacterized membrane protein HdeD (DUF308 family)
VLKKIKDIYLGIQKRMEAKKNRNRIDLSSVIFGLLLILMYVSCVDKQKVDCLMTPIIFAIGYIVMKCYNENVNTNSVMSKLTDLVKGENSESTNVYICHLVVILPFLLYIFLQDSLDKETKIVTVTFGLIFLIHSVCNILYTEQNCENFSVKVGMGRFNGVSSSTSAVNTASHSQPGYTLRWL